MNLKIIELKTQIFHRIQDAAANQRAFETLHLAPILDRLNKMEADANRIVAELREIEGILPSIDDKSPLADGPSNPSQPMKTSRYSSKSPQSKLRITVRWRLAGKEIENEELCERFANETQAKFLGRLITVLGTDARSKILRFSSTSGGRMHITENPNVDPAFRNRQTDKLYAHVLIPGTQLYVLTNTSTDEKQRDLESLVNYLGLPTGFAEIQQIPQST